MNPVVRPHVIRKREGIFGTFSSTEREKRFILDLKFGNVCCELWR